MLARPAFPTVNVAFLKAGMFTVRHEAFHTDVDEILEETLSRRANTFAVHTQTISDKACPELYLQLREDICRH